MLLLGLALSLALQTPGPDTVPAAPAAALADAYLDAPARETVRRARERREVVDRSITAYRVLARERLSVGLRALSRDRTLFRRELAARILWRRGLPGRVELLGARQVAPVAVHGADVPGDAGDEAANLAFDPANLILLREFTGDADGDGDGIRHPLAPGSEAVYRFASGDTTVLRLADGRTIRLLELRVLPRRPSGLLLRGSFWMDADTHAPVRAAFRLARPLDLVRDVDDEDDDEDVPGWLQPMEADLRYLTIDYSLWDGRWWMPRLIALEGEASVGGMMRVPVRFERAYDEYEVEGEGAAPLRLAVEDTLGPAPGSEAERDTVTVAGSPGISVRIRRECERKECWRYRLDRPADSVLVRSEYLPASPYGDEALISEGELQDLAAVLGAGVPGQSAWHPPVLRWGFLRPELLRYDRVEGLALGARLDADLGAVTTDATLWLGTSDLEPGAEIGVAREGFRAAQRLALYRRLVAVEPDPRALGFGSSLSALLFGRDDGDYYRTLGAELRGTPLGTPRWRYGWRLFAERQEGAEKSTDFSVARLFDESRGFRPALAADAADQAGAELSLRTGREWATGWRWGGEVAVLGSVGTFDFVRPAVGAFLGFPLPGPLGGGVELAGGHAAGAVPTQSLWYLGGPTTVRGYGGDSRVAGDAFWRGRAEIGTALPAARISLFSDAGWAGSRRDPSIDPGLLSAGVGLGFLDGLVRLDLARALRGERGWRLDLHLDAVM